MDREFDEMQRDGVRSMLLLNKFDTPLTGVRFDEGPIGTLINGANKLGAGTYWYAQTCPGPLHGNTIYQPDATTGAGLSTLALTFGLPGGTTPTYPPTPHRNKRGLTQLGTHVFERMMDDHMIVNPDHMSQAAVAATLSLLEARRYSGVISPPGWMDPGDWPRIWKLGGMAFPGHSAASQYVKDWQTYRPKSTPYAFGWGYGADLGGPSHQLAADPNDQLTYPFRSIDGKVTFQRQGGRLGGLSGTRGYRAPLRLALRVQVPRAMGLQPREAELSLCNEWRPQGGPASRGPPGNPAPTRWGE